MAGPHLPAFARCATLLSTRMRSSPGPLVMKGCAPFVDVETPPRSKASAAPAADEPSGPNSG
eukprot:867603-Alexandrium_andersonii.AAC.1